MTKGKTLAELDVKPGDVIYHHNPALTSRRGGDRIYTLGEMYADGPFWHIVSRANEPDKPKWGPWMLRDFRQSWDSVEFAHECQVSEDTNGDVVAYRIRKEPVRETVTLYGSTDGFGAGGSMADYYQIAFDTIDGKPDCSSIRMEAIGDE